jgi:predicted O-methyltransferase YrrM
LEPTQDFDPLQSTPAMSNEPPAARALVDEEAMRRAWAAGGDVDLAGLEYGPAEWAGGFSHELPGYYRLLAGLVRAHRFARVCELGTHYGGATAALARGMAADGMIVTVDVSALDSPALEGERRVQRVCGDALSAAVVDDVARRFTADVDLLFVDIVHGYHQTKRAVGLYANRLRPRLIVLDDIHLNGGMDLLWRELAATSPSFDATALCSRGAPGFGVLAPPPGARFHEGDAWRARLWSARRAVAARVPYAAKVRARRVLDALPPRVRTIVDPS